MSGVVLNRGVPKYDVGAYQTYGVKRLNWRIATCREVNCPHREHGWQQAIDLNTPLGQDQARHIKYHAGRTYTKVSQAEGIVVLAFAAGQNCFTEHRVPVDEKTIYVLRDGDHRGNPTGRKRVLSPIAWRDDFGENQEKYAELVRRG